MINSLKHDNILGLTFPIRIFADDYFIFDENGRSFFKLVENTVGKRGNFLLRAISPFPTVFSIDLLCRHVKPKLVWERVDQNGSICRNEKRLTEKKIKFFRKGKNILGGEFACYQYFLLSHIVYQKHFFLRVL